MEKKTPTVYLIDSVCKPNEKPENVQEGEIWATHSGVLEIEGFKMRCYILSNGERTFDQDDVEAFFGRENLKNKL